MLAIQLQRSRRRKAGSTWLLRCFLLWALWGAIHLAPLRASAAIQFDVFLGFDGVLPEASWFPITSEIKNDGASFTGLIEVSDAFGQGPKTLMQVELPTGTLKRVLIPLFNGARGYHSFNVRLLDEKGKTRGEHLGIRPRRTVAAGMPLVCGITRTVNGVPILKQGASANAEHQLPTARLQPALFPDNPIVLEGMQSLYLNSERATELSVAQVAALLGWVNSGGQLILSVEQAGDVTARPWLKDLLPCELGELTTAALQPELQQWLGRGSGLDGSGEGETAGQQPPGPLRARFNEPTDLAFEVATAQLLASKPLRGTVLLDVGGMPAIIEAPQGRGRVTVLLFSPEREPYRSWKNLPAFWAKIVAVPPQYYSSNNHAGNAYYSTDAVFGAMLDTRQVNKLPYHWLLLLLVVYLVVIGPLDMYWLRKINRPMLTWITFPSYVVFFSLLIYFIGYMLRAGESEWNELHVVDVVPSGDQAQVRGRTFASVYSPANQTFALQGQQRFATFRPEFGGSSWQGRKANTGEVLVSGDSYKASLFVPVWTSQLMVSDWVQSGTTPLKARLTRSDQDVAITVENRTGRKLQHAKLAIGNGVFDLGELPLGIKEFNFANHESRALSDTVQEASYRFQSAVQGRQHAFGNQSGHLEDPISSSFAVSFISSARGQESNQGRHSLLTPPGLDLTETLESGTACLLAWDSGHSPTKSMHQFSPKRSAKNTLWRVVVN